MSRLAFPATPEDHPALERVLVRAFTEDPVMRWFDPSPPQRERRLLRLFDHVLKKYLPRGTVAAGQRSFADLPGTGEVYDGAPTQGPYQIGV